MLSTFLDENRQKNRATEVKCNELVKEVEKKMKLPHLKELLIYYYGMKKGKKVVRKKKEIVTSLSTKVKGLQTLSISSNKSLILKFTSISIAGMCSGFSVLAWICEIYFMMNNFIRAFPIDLNSDRIKELDESFPKP